MIIMILDDDVLITMMTIVLMRMIVTLVVIDNYVDYNCVVYDTSYFLQTL